MALRLGIDVGGTNTDAVLLDENDNLMAKVKTPTTQDITTGITKALDKISEGVKSRLNGIACAMLGTTQCTNAIVERKQLNKVGIIRLGAPATLSLKPFITWPDDLVQQIGGCSRVVSGGHEYDGREISPIHEEEIAEVAREFKDKGVESIAISSVFSPVNNEHEVKAAEIVRNTWKKDIHISLSNEIGRLSLLERENAAILNAAIIKVAERAILGFRDALEKKGIQAKLYLTQNDGTLMSAEYALKYPVFTIASGPSNSLMGASFLSEMENCIVVDVGGTTTDVGVISKGMPRDSVFARQIGGVTTNFRMPDLLSIGLGGGSIIRGKEGEVSVGPDSVGYRITEEAFVFGGSTLTATDVAVCLGKASLGDISKVRSLSKGVLKEADLKIIQMVEEAIDKMKTTPEPVPVVLVGGGSILLSADIRGASPIIRPAHFEVASAIGAAIAQVSGEIDKVFSLDKSPREEVLQDTLEMAVKEAVKAGADPKSVEIISVEEIPLTYLPGNAVRMKVKAVGKLMDKKAEEKRLPLSMDGYLKSKPHSSKFFRPS